MNELQNILISAAITIVPLLAAVVVQLLRSYLDTKKEEIHQRMDSQTWYQLQEFARLAVNAAEQYKKTVGWDNERAKDFVTSRLMDTAAEWGLQLTHHQADLMVEGVYKSAREWFEPTTTTINTITIEDTAVIEPA